MINRRKELALVQESGQNLPLVALVSPVHNNRQDTKEFLESLKGVRYPNYVIIIVDDGSTDGTEGMIRSEYPYIILLKGDGNLWANRSYNWGMRKAIELGSEYILWIDNDTVVDPDFISVLVETAEANPGALVTSKVCYFDNPKLFFEVGGDMNWLKGGYIQRGHQQIDEGQYEEQCEVKCATLGVLIPTSVINEIGYIDAEYFPHYRGDVDFTYRAYKRGHRIIYEPRSKIWHKVSSTAKKGKILREVSFTRSPLAALTYTFSNRSRGGSLSLREIVRFYLRHFPLALPYILAYYAEKRLIREMRGRT